MYLSLHALENLDFFPLPFTREGRITACDRVYAYKGFHEAVLVNGRVELLLQAVNYRKFYYPGLRSSSLLHVALSKVSLMNKQ